VNYKNVTCLNRAADYLEKNQLEAMRIAAEAGLNHADKEALEQAVKWIRELSLWFASKRIGHNVRPKKDGTKKIIQEPDDERDNG